MAIYVIFYLGGVGNELNSNSAVATRSIRARHGTGGAEELPDPANRNDKIGDLQFVAALAVVAVSNAVVVFQLYISSRNSLVAGAVILPLMLAAIQ
jgi:hypothetical protein